MLKFGSNISRISKILCLTKFDSRYFVSEIVKQPIQPKIKESSRYQSLFDAKIKLPNPKPRRRFIFDYLLNHNAEENIKKLKEVSLKGTIKQPETLTCLFYQKMVQTDKSKDIIKELTNKEIGLDLESEKSLSLLLRACIKESPENYSKIKEVILKTKNEGDLKKILNTMKLTEPV